LGGCSWSGVGGLEGRSQRRCASSAPATHPVVDEWRPDPLHRAAPAAVSALTQPAGSLRRRSAVAAASTESSCQRRQLLLRAASHRLQLPAGLAAVCSSSREPAQLSTLFAHLQERRWGRERPGAATSPNRSPLIRTGGRPAINSMPAAIASAPDRAACSVCCRLAQTIPPPVHRSPGAERDPSSSDAQIRPGSCSPARKTAGKLLPGAARGGTNARRVARPSAQAGAPLHWPARRLSSWPAGAN